MKDVYLVRHGKSDANEDGIFRADASRLTAEGEEQARIVGERIQTIGVDALVSSPWPRALATANAIARATGLPIEQSELFTERRNPSAFTGRSRSEPEMRSAVQEIFEGHATPNHRHSDEENAEDLFARAAAALHFLETHPAERICVVTHGVFMRALACAVVWGDSASGKELQRFLHHFDTDNTGVTHLQYRKNTWAEFDQDAVEWYIKSWNDRAHFG